MKKNDVDYLLYAVTDFSSYPQHDALQSMRDALNGGVTVIQLREKHLSTMDIVKKAQTLIPVCHAANACFIINDDVEAASLCDADGVHVGQHDQTLTEVRKKLGPDKIIGVSVQTVEQAEIACRDGADYLGVGAMFPTTTKQDADAVTIETLKAICEASTVPVVAIGGINLKNLDKLADTGINGVAVVSAIFAPDDVRLAASGLHEAVKKLFC